MIKEGADAESPCDTCGRDRVEICRDESLMCSDYSHYVSKGEVISTDRRPGRVNLFKAFYNVVKVGVEKKDIPFIKLLAKSGYSAKEIGDKYEIHSSLVKKIVECGYE